MAEQKKQRLAARANIKKAATFAIIVNALETVLILGVMVYLLVEDRSPLHIRLLAGAATLLVGAGAVVDIRDALTYRSLHDQIDAILGTLQNIETLNLKLRTQRHDFLNHLQVVYSLMEMKEYAEAGAYIEKVYGSIQAVSRTMKTASPAINALLQVKTAAAEQAGIRVRLNIVSPWRGLPVPAWEMCKVLSNLWDNAMDAMKDTPSPEITLSLSESDRAFHFRVENTGPVIPADLMETLFQPGVTTKEEGHGMGLHIVKTTLEKYGGHISVTSADGRTAFFGDLPKSADVNANEISVP